MSESGVTGSLEKKKGLKELRAEVLDTDACTACGTCVYTCPYIHAMEDRVVVVSECRIAEGSCYLACPRTEPIPSICDNIYGDSGFNETVGPVLEYMMARSSLVQDHANVQYGGIVTTLLLKAMKTEVVNRAVVTKEAVNLPLPFVAVNNEEILSAAGSKYALAPTNKEVNRILPDSKHQIAAVTLPCQATGLRKKQLFPSERDYGEVKLVIGLFCTWALGQKGWRQLLQKYVGAEPVQRIHIPPPPAQHLEIVTAQERHAIPLEEVRSHVRPGCQVCMDMTAENADLAVGMVEGEEAWNTVIIRTERGKALWDDAVASGEIEVAPLDARRWEHLQGASLTKKKRAVAEAQKRIAQEPLPYYERLQKIKDRFEGDAQ